MWVNINNISFLYNLSIKGFISIGFNKSGYNYGVWYQVSKFIVFKKFSIF